MNKNESILNGQEAEKVFIFRTSGGAALEATLPEFNRNWREYILSRGETYVAIPRKLTPDERAEDNGIDVFDEILTDRNGKSFSVWTVYQGAKVVSVEFTRSERHLLTDRVEFAS